MTPRSAILTVWGKSHINEPNSTSRHEWLPLWMHAKDTLEVAIHLWDNWVPQRIKLLLSSDLGFTESEARNFFAWLAALHDIGKGTPGFYHNKGESEKEESARIANKRMRESLGVTRNPLDAAATWQRRHEMMGFAILQRIYLDPATDRNMSARKVKQRVQSVFAPIAGHHGTFASVNAQPDSLRNARELATPWIEAQDELLRYINSLLPGTPSLAQRALENGMSQRSAMLLSALILTSDWISSGFDLISIKEVPDLDHSLPSTRAAAQLSRITLPPRFDAGAIVRDERSFLERFGFEMNDMQREFLSMINESDASEIFILEAAMGGGKTEAALFAAEILMSKGGFNGVYFGLPTMSTSESIYKRALLYFRNLAAASQSRASVSLLHSRDHISKNYAKAKSDARKDSSDLAPEGFFRRRDFRLFNTFVVGTIDQLLMMALRTKRNYLRHLGMASKVVILDEIHSADDYMIEYLKRSIEWLGFYGVPVILLSATLTNDTAESLIGAYNLGKERAKEVLDVSSDS